MDTLGPVDNLKAGPTAGSSDYKQQVLAAVDVVDLIGRTVSLKRRGKDYLGLCPFHQEKSPSFSVSPSKQFFHCYGCKASGNAIDFVIKRDRVPFLDALRLLGDAAGIERPHASPQARQAAGQRQQLLDCCSTAANLFQRLLAHPTAGAAGRAYLAQRGFDDEVARRFQIGLAPDAWDRLLRAEPMRPFPPAVMAAAGLVKPREAAAGGGKGNGFYDTFRNRLMFPIRDETGRVIAFGGRTLPGSTDKAKYLNSPETPLFSKGRTVFGLDLARQRVVETRTVAVVEGYADVVMAHQFGATNVVSVLGTALTEGHVTILRRFADKIVLLFDADAAGDTAVNRAVELFLTQPVEIAIASLPDGLDPDEFLLAHGADAFDAVLKGAADALTFTWTQLVRQFVANDGDLTGQERAVRHYLELLARARASGPVDSLRWGSALTRVSRLTGIPVPDLNRRFSQPATQQSPSPSQPPAAGGYRSGGADRFNRTRRPGGDWKRRGPIGSGRPAFGRGGSDRGREDGHSELVDYRTLAERPVAPTARASAERWILAVLLAEPGLWHGIVDRVHVGDFTADDRRRLAELYWNHQQDEGEPAFNEFLEVLRAAGEPVAGTDLTSLAVALVAEFDARPAGPDGELTDPAVLLAEMVALLVQLREGRVGDKLLADLRRTSGAPVPPAGSPVAPVTSAEVLRQLQERARRPDLRRVGS